MKVEFSCSFKAKKSKIIFGFYKINSSWKVIIFNKVLLKKISKKVN